MTREKILFVTGRLAAPALQDVVQPLAAQQGFDYEIAVVGITVAALMQSTWLARKLTVPTGISRVILPGWCGGSVESLAERFGVPFESGRAICSICRSTSAAPADRSQSSTTTASRSSPKSITLRICPSTNSSVRPTTTAGRGRI